MKEKGTNAACLPVHCFTRPLPPASQKRVKSPSCFTLSPIAEVATSLAPAIKIRVFTEESLMPAFNVPLSFIAFTTLTLVKP